LNIRAIFREPLVHFLLIGLLLFLVYGRVAPERADRRTIEVSKARIESLSKQFESVWNRPPSSEEMRGIIDSYVRDEVLYREGVSLGLDGDDPVIKRRVRQKLEVISEESGNQVAATDAELSAYLSKNADKFRQAPILSFEQVFFSGDAPVSQVEQQSRDALAALNQGTPATDVGQSTMLPGRVEAMPADLVARDFGEEFAKKLESMPLNVWQGPIASGFGAHLVRVSARIPAELPPLADIRPLVLREWENARRERNRAEVLKGMMKNYTVVIDSETVKSDITP